MKFEHALSQRNAVNPKIVPCIALDTIVFYFLNILVYLLVRVLTASITGLYYLLCKQYSDTVTQ